MHGMGAMCLLPTGAAALGSTSRHTQQREASPQAGQHVDTPVYSGAGPELPTECRSEEQLNVSVDLVVCLGSCWLEVRLTVACHDPRDAFPLTT
jgi:hypothetical protein